MAGKNTENATASKKKNKIKYFKKMSKQQKDKKKISYNLKESVDRFESSKNRKEVVKILKNNNKKIKSTKNIIAYDPATKQYVSGNISEVAKKIKSSANTIKTRFANNKDLNGFVLMKFSNAEDMVNFKNNLGDDIKVIKPKAKAIIDGALYLNMLEPTYKIKSAGKVDNVYWGNSEQRFNLEISDDLTMEQIHNIFKTTANLQITGEGLTAKDKIRVIIEDPNLSSSSHKGVISTGLMNVEDWKPSLLFDLVENTIESNEEWQVSSSSKITITSINFGAQ
tara:strand:- start:198 stop:1040 length:843 start_codon:yes stop_codon:yes gene_type:complete